MSSSAIAERSAHAARKRGSRQQDGARGARGSQRHGNPSSKAILLTGATGFLGMGLLARYLERTDRRVYALVRGADDDDSRLRLQRTLVDLFGEGHRYGERVTALCGDITRPNLGLGARADDVAAGVGEIVHAAASVSFELGHEPSWKINVGGTRNVLEFAERCHAHGGLRRLCHISTTYVAGRHAGSFGEDELAVGQRFRNAYERSKFEAELEVRAWRERLPITVLRPSIIVGERDSGWTTSFNVLYWPLRAFARGAYVAVPFRRSAPVDVVSVDYVADAIIALSQLPDAEDGTYHLTAGADASTVGELVDLACSTLRLPPPRLIEPRLYRWIAHPLLRATIRDPRRRRTLVRSEVFFPYFEMGLTFDDLKARSQLDALGIKPSRLCDYFEKLIEFALASDWGRRPMSRARASARARFEQAAPASPARELSTAAR
jgi:thioester reductase-like protein